MSSDTFSVQITAIRGTTVELTCRTSTAGGYSDYACTRSFALMALEDCMPSTYSGKKTPLQARMFELAGGGQPPVWEAAYHRAHVGEFIARAELVSRSGIITNEGAWARGRFAEGPGYERLYPLHSFVLRIEMTDPRWLEGLKVGAGGGTTAFDAWWDDPKRQSRAQLAAIERKATRWRPPGKDGAAKKSTAEKSTAKKAVKAAATKSTKKTSTKANAKKAAKKTAKKAAKKTATKATAKKAAAKKTATKKTAVKKTATKKTVAKKTAAKKTAAKKTAAKKTAAKKTAAKKTAAKKTATKKTAKKAAAKKTAKKAAAKKSTAKKTATRRSS